MQYSLVKYLAKVIQVGLRVLALANLLYSTWSLSMANVWRGLVSVVDLDILRGRTF